MLQMPKGSEALIRLVLVLVVSSSRSAHFGAKRNGKGQLKNAEKHQLSGVWKSLSHDLAARWKQSAEQRPVFELKRSLIHKAKWIFSSFGFEGSGPVVPKFIHM